MDIWYDEEHSTDYDYIYNVEEDYLHYIEWIYFKKFSGYTEQSLTCLFAGEISFYLYGEKRRERTTTVRN